MIDYLYLPRVDPPGSSTSTLLYCSQGKHNLGKNNLEVKRTFPEPVVPVVVSKAAKQAAAGKGNNTAEVARATGSSPTRESSPSAKMSSRHTALLPWSAESLASLLTAHRALAAILLRSERTRELQPHDKNCGHHRLHSVELFRKADASLTVALTAAGFGLVPPTPNFTAKEKSSRESDRPVRPLSDSQTHAAVTGVVTATAGADTIVELYSMRCSVREKLGLFKEALDDVREALTVAPKAPKLWATAASLALRVVSDAEGEGERDRGNPQQPAPFNVALEVRIV